MKNKEQGFIARLSSQVKVVAVLILVVVSAFALVASFGAGFAAGVIVSSHDTKRDCVRGGGTWSAEERMCESAPDVTAPVQPVTQGKRSYTCPNGTQLEVEEVDPEVIHVMPLDGFGTKYILPLVSLGNLGPTYSNGSVSMGFQGNIGTYENTDSGEDTTCTLDAS